MKQVRHSGRTGGVGPYPAPNHSSPCRVNAKESSVRSAKEKRDGARRKAAGAPGPHSSAAHSSATETSFVRASSTATEGIGWHQMTHSTSLRAALSMTAPLDSGV